MKKSSKIAKIILLLLPLAFGSFGQIVVARQPVLNSLFNCLLMYFVNYSGAPVNLWVEIARWSAPLATAGSVILLLSELNSRFLAWSKYLIYDSVAVYGPEDDQALVLPQLGRSGFSGGDKFHRANRYLLLNDEKENFAFYSAHREEMRRTKVYLKSGSLRGQSASDTNLKLFCPEETAARIFWKQQDLCERFGQGAPRLRIAFVGFDLLGEELLYSGLQNNIFAPDQRIEYHIFGEDRSFAAKHPRLDLISDPVLFHREHWYEQLDLLANADLLLVLEQEAQLALTKDLLALLPEKTFTVFAEDPKILELLDERERLLLFDWEKEALKIDYIMDDLLFERAKRINLRYSHLYHQVTENEAACEAEWKKLDAFTRYSNVSSADYHEIRLQMLRHMGLPADGSGLSPEQMEFLAELEHIRWCRYHWLNHWQYGVPADGKAKDAAKRIHTDLIPYQDLSEEEKEKDRETIRVLLSLD